METHLLCLNSFEGDPETSTKHAASKDFGFVPSAINVPLHLLINSDTGLFKTAEEITDLLRRKRVDLNRAFVTMGVNAADAAVLNVALELIGVPRENVGLYEGGFTEWISKDKSPIKRRLVMLLFSSMQREFTSNRHTHHGLYHFHSATLSQFMDDPKRLEAC